MTSPVDVIAELQMFADSRPKLRGWDVARAFSDLAPIEDVMYLNTFMRPDAARQRMLDALAELGDTEFTREELETVAGVGKSTARDWVKRFADEGLIEMVVRRYGNDPARYRVKEADNGD